MLSRDYFRFFCGLSDWQRPEPGSQFSPSQSESNVQGHPSALGLAVHVSVVDPACAAAGAEIETIKGSASAAERPRF